MKWKKVGKVVGISLSVLVFLVGVLILSGYLFLDNWLESYLQKRADKASKGQYSLKVNDIYVDYTDFSIHFDALELTTDSSQLSKIRARNEKPFPLLHVNLTGAVLQNINILPVLFGGDLSVGRIILEKPDISVTYLSKDDKKSGQKLSAFFDQLSPAFFDITAKKLQVNNGNLKHLIRMENEQILATDFSFEFKNFSFDTFTLPRALFPSKNLKLLIDGKLSIKRSPVNLEINEVLSENSEVLLNNINLHTSSNVDATIEKVYANLSEKLDIDKKALAVNFLYVKKPDIKVVFSDSGTKEDPISGKYDEQSLERLILPFLNTLYIAEITTVKGKLLALSRKSTLKKYLASGIFTSISGFLVSSEKPSPKRFFNSQRAVVSITDSLFINHDSLLISGGFAKLSTDSGIELRNLVVRKDLPPGCYPNSSYFELEIKKVESIYRGWEELPGADSLKISLVKIFQPDLYFIRASGKQDKKHSIKKSIYQSVSKFASILQIDSIKVLNGSLNIVLCKPGKNKELFLAGVGATITDILLDSSDTEEDRFLFAQKITGHINKSSFLTGKGKVTVGDISFNTEKGFTSDNLVIQKSGKQKLFAQFPTLKADFTNWSALVEPDTYINIKSITLLNPHFSITTEKVSSGEENGAGIIKKIEDLFPPLTVESVKILNAELKFARQEGSEGLKAYINSFNLIFYNIKIPSESQDRILFSKQFKFEINGNAEISKNLYTATLDYLKASSLSGITAKNCKVITDTSKYLAKVRKSKPTFYYFTVPRFTISSIDWRALLNGEEVKLGVIHVQDPVIRIRDIEEDHPPKESIVEIHNQIKPYVDAIKAEEFLINNGSLEFSRYNDPDTSFYSVKLFHLTLKNIYINSGSPFAANRVFYSKKAKLSAKGLFLKRNDSFYNLNIDSININTGPGEAKAFNLNYSPFFSETQIRKYVKAEDDVVNLQVPVIKVFDFNWQEFFTKKRDIIAREVVLQNLNLIITRDRALPNEKKNRPAPHVLFRELKEVVKIDSLFLENGYLAYTEIAEKSNDTGTVFISSLNTSIYNFSNIKSQLAQKPIKIKNKGYFLGLTPLRVIFSVDVYSPQNAFTYEGETGSLDLKKLNTVLIPLASLRVKSGYLNNMTFEVNADENSANGTMYAYYKDLEIELLDKGKEKDDKDIMSFFANVIINSDNLKGEDDFRVGEIEFERENQKSYLNYTWKAYRKGILSSIGVLRAKKIKKKVKSFLPFIGD